VSKALLTMIAHLNLTKRVTDDEKQVWRSRLWWGGPFIASWYLLTVRE
jgi:hypothetical protein